MLIAWNVKWQPNGYGIPLGVEKLESRQDGIENYTVHEFFQFRVFVWSEKWRRNKIQTTVKRPCDIGGAIWGQGGHDRRDDVFSYTVLNEQLLVRNPRIPKITA